MTRIPLFPLNTVLFPGMWLPLHIFEERYRQMLEDCRQGDNSFGVALIRSGEEVGETATPFEVGTLARIMRTVPLTSGGFFVQTRGAARFRVQRLIHDRLYLEGDVELISTPDSGTAVPSGLVSQARSEYREFVEAVKAAGGRIDEELADTPDPVSFSWVVAATLVVGTGLRQELLETDDTAHRLTREIELLAACSRALKEQAGRRPPRRTLPFSVN